MPCSSRRATRLCSIEAIQEFQKALKAEPRLAPMRDQRALAQLQAGSPQQAKTELKEAVTIAPSFADAGLLLADLNIRAGAAQPAIEDLERLLTRQPKAAAAHVLLGSAYLAKREPVRATDVYRRLAALAPKDPRGNYLVGVGLLAQSKRAEARKEFEAALALAPGFVDPLTQLIALSFAEKQPHQGLERVKRQAALPPRSATHRFLVGKAIEGNPKNVSALMLAGVIHEQRGDIPKAREFYEKVLALSPRFAPAANNLAWVLAEQGGDSNRALALAQTAKEQAPEDPHVSDTLGWILYRPGVHQRALALLKDSAARLPGNQQVQYHLGMVSAQLGDKEAARQALAAAAASPTPFPDQDEARKALAALRCWVPRIGPSRGRRAPVPRRG